MAQPNGHALNFRKNLLNRIRHQYNRMIFPQTVGHSMLLYNFHKLRDTVCYHVISGKFASGYRLS